MGQRMWMGACALVAACYVAGHLIAQEPAAENPFDDSGAGSAHGADATDGPFGAAASGAPPALSDAPDPFAAAPGPEVAETPTEVTKRAAPYDEATSYSAQQRIEAALNQRLTKPLDFPETPLCTIMQLLSEEYDIPVEFDMSALEAVAQSPDTEVSVHYSAITLRSALELMLRQCEDLTYIIDNEVLVITTEDEAQTRLRTIVYQVDDLMPSQGGGGANGNVTVEAPIVEVITRCVEQDSWARNKKGEGEICVLEPGIMVICQTQRVHDEIAKLLAEIRRVKAAIKDRPTGGY